MRILTVLDNAWGPIYHLLCYCIDDTELAGLKFRNAIQDAGQLMERCDQLLNLLLLHIVCKMDASHATALTTCANGNHIRGQVWMVAAAPAPAYIVRIVQLLQLFHNQHTV